MHKSSILNILRNFTPEEMKEFGDYVKSGFFNKNENVIKLYNYLRKYHPEFESPGLSKEAVYKKIIGDGYDDGYMRLTIYKLQKLAEEYLAYKKYKKDERREHIFLTDELMIRSDNKLIDKKLKESEKYLKDKGYDEPDDYYYKFQIEFQKNCRKSEKFMQNKKQIPDDSVYEEPQYLAKFFILRMLANHFYHLNQSMLINYKPRLIFLDEIVKYIDENPDILKEALINISYYRVMLLKEKKDEYYYKLKDSFFKELKNLASEDNFNTLSILINYCQSKQLETGSKQYNEEKYKLLDHAVRNGVYSFRKGGYFDAGKFKGYVSAAIELGKPEEAKEFVKRYKNKLEPENKQTFELMSYASIAFSEGQYEKTLELLNRISSMPEISTKLSIRVLYLKTYYELGWIEQAISLSDSFRHYLTKMTEIPERTKEAFKNFLLIYNGLIGLINKFDEYKQHQLNLKLEPLTIITEKSWLKDKMGCLIEQFPTTRKNTIQS